MISVPVIKNTPEIFPFPIFDSIEYYHSESWLDGPIRSNATRILTRIINSTHELSKDWSPIYLQLADRFLCKHLGQANTFNRFKNEIERFTLWLAIEHKKNPMELDSNDINDFLEFLETPKKTWVSAYNSPRVTSNDDKVILNTDWRPIRARRPKGVKLPPLNSSDPLLRELRHQSDRELINSYSPKISSIAASIRALRPFYNYLIHQQKMTEKGFRETGDNSGLISTEMNISNPISD